MANKSKKEAEILDVNETLNKSEAYISKHKKPILIGLVAVVVVIAALFVYNGYVSGPRATKASTALAKCQSFFSSGMYDLALNGDSTTFYGLKGVISDYKGTDAANLAKLYAGLCCANMEQWQEAVDYLESFSPANDAMISPAAVAALGNAYANIGDVDKAVSKLKKAADMADSKADNGTNMSLAPIWLMQAGVLLESQGKTDEALKIYKKVKDTYFNASAVQSGEVDKYIERASK